MSRSRRWAPRSCVLGRTHIYFDMGAPCVLASRRPSSASRRAITLNRAQRAAEDDLGLAERYPVAVAKPFPLDPTSVEKRPVHRAEVDDPVGRALLPELRVPARDVEIGNADVAVPGTSEDDSRRCDVVASAGPGPGYPLTLRF